MFQMIPTFQTSDGKSHRDMDQAISHERFVNVRNMLIQRMDEFALPVAVVDKLAHVICETQTDVADIFKIDLKRQLSSNGFYFSGGRTSALGADKTPAISGQGEHIAPKKPEGMNEDPDHGQKGTGPLDGLLSAEDLN